MYVEPEDSRPTSPFQEFFRTEAAGGALLVACACAALVVANSAWADAYRRLLSVMIAIGAGGHALTLTLHQWINDALMAVFFLLVGLEIKRGAISYADFVELVGSASAVSVPAAVSLERKTHARERIRRPFVAAGR